MAGGLIGILYKNHISNVMGLTCMLTRVRLKASEDVRLCTDVTARGHVTATLNSRNLRPLDDLVDWLMGIDQASKSRQ